MPSETFYCPHCKRQLTKSAQAYVLGEMMASKKSYFVGLGELSSTVVCPGCRGWIDTMKMIHGEYDLMTGKPSHPFVSLIAGIGFFLGAIVTAGGLHESFHWGWLPSLFVGLFGGFLVAGIVAGILTFLGKPFFRK